MILPIWSLLLLMLACAGAQTTQPGTDDVLNEIRRRVPKQVALPSPAAIPRSATVTVDVATLLAEASRNVAAGRRGGKPCPWLVKAHDVGVPTDFHKDIPWHALDKEKDERFTLPHAGKLGLVNTSSDVNFLIGLGLDDVPVDFNPLRKCTDHLVNLIAYEVTLGPIRGRVVFLPIASDTLLAVVQLQNAGSQPHAVRVESVCTKPPVELKPVDRYGYGVTPLTGKLQWVGYNEANAAVVCSFDEWGPHAPTPIGTLLATMAGSERPAGYRVSIARDAAAQAEQTEHVGPREGVLEFRFDLGVGERRVLLIALNLHRFGPRSYEAPMEIVLYPQQTPDEALEYSIRSAVDALGADWPKLVRDSFRWYERLPAVRLPRPSWTADLCCAMELPRGETWSGQGKLPQPWYTLCRVHVHEPYGWWSYGMHGHEHLSTFVVNLTEPTLSQSFLRGHFQNQQPDGRMPYGINHRGVSAHSGDLATCPLLAWESWTAYAWSGDRAFLKEAYAAAARCVRWWRSPARTRGEVGLQHWKDFLETVRDDADLATWTATDGAQGQEALDLNCYLLNEEQALALMARELGRGDEMAQWQADAARRQATMRRQLWHAEDRVYYGRDLLRDRWARVMDVSTFFPLWCGLATAEQAPRFIELLRDPTAFGTEYPVATLAVRHMPPKMRGQWHWRGANWVEMSWLVVLGLKHYGYYREAARVAELNCRMVFDTLEKTGHFREYFDSLTGAPVALTDYIWTSMPAAMAIDVFLGIRPTAGGLEVLPALPEGWPAVAVDNLRVRAAQVSVGVMRDPAHSETTATVNGLPHAVEERRGVYLPWSELPNRCAIVIIQPEAIPETIVPRPTRR